MCIYIYIYTHMYKHIIIKHVYVYIYIYIYTLYIGGLEKKADARVGAVAALQVLVLVFFPSQTASRLWGARRLRPGSPSRGVT